MSLAPTCGWPSCGASSGGDDVLVRDGDDASWLCLEHLTDDFLPTLLPGVCGACSSCGHVCLTWLVVEGEPDRALHDRCRRSWAMAQVAPTHERGAWARRRVAADSGAS